MITHPGEYRWSSHAQNAAGTANATLIPHPEYLRLGATPETRQHAYCDQFPPTHQLGHWFVTQYYKYCPPLADFLRQHDGLRTLVRTALSPLVELSRAVVSKAVLVEQQ